LLNNWQSNQKVVLNEKVNNLEENVEVESISSAEINEEFVEDKEVETLSNNCEIFWTDPIFEEIGEVQPLFLKEASGVQGTGYEAIIRKVVSDDGYIDVDIVTNCLPKDLGPYYLFVLAVDDKGNVCFQDNLGQLEYSEDPCFWSSGNLSLPVDNVNDSQVFAITSNGFGESDSDHIDHINHSSIILLGNYASDYMKSD
jgi:hypothetical protein